LRQSLGRGPHARRAATALCAIGAGALALLVGVSIAGGFTLGLGALRLSVHNLRGPALVVLLSWASATTLVGPRGVRRSFDALGGLFDSRAHLVAIVCAAIAAGAGVGLGTHAASGADAAGYLSQARLLAQGRLVQHEPLATQVDWPYATDAFSPLGYRSGRTPGAIVPTYPPGLPMLMASARWAGGEWAPFLVVPLLGALAVLCTYRLGALLHAPAAGAVGAALMATSPVFLFQVVQPMSDVAAIAFWALAAVLALSSRPALAGAAAGVAAMVRPNLAPLWLPIGLACLSAHARTSRGLCPDIKDGAFGWFPGARTGLGTWLRFAAPFAAALAILAVTQWTLYGNPVSSGHGAVSDLFAPGNIGQNVRDYIQRLWRGEPAALGVSVISAAILAVRPGRKEARDALRPVVRPFVLVMAVLLAIYLPYGVFPDWSYLRFLMPALPFAFVTVGTLIALASTRVPPWMRGPLVIVTLAAVVSSNLTVARREQVFDLRRHEGRYRTAGRYLEAVLPADSVIVTSQESTAAHYYTGLPILHWDLLFADLDAAAATLRSLGRAPVLVVEDWEAPALRQRFQTSALARLDWLPRAEIGETTRVRVFDPTDRTRADVITDRIR
jgi:hypothetical protein